MAKTAPAVPEPSTQEDPRQTQRKKRVLERQRREIEKNEKEISDAADRIQKKVNDTFNFVCALRLDMVADQLEKINPKWAHEIDMIANQIEKRSHIE